MSAKILLIEDNPHILKANREALSLDGFHVLEAQNLSRGMALFEAENPEIIILDIMLPDGDGLSFCKELRAMPGGNNTSILMLSAKTEKPEIKEGLDIGADDYLTKPYDLDELTSRVNALLRRSMRTPKTVTKGALVLNVNSNQAFVNGVDILLSQNIEFSLLNLFASDENKILSTEYLYREVWGQPMRGNDKALRTAVSEVRKKLRGSGYTITSEHGKGYIFERG